MTTLYETDLAHVHHTGFGDLARGAAPGLLAMLEDAGITSGHVLDLGCGSGIWLRALERAGYAGTGIDASPALLALARRQAPRAQLIEGSVHTAALPRADAVTAIGEVLAYLPVRGRAPDLARTFRRVARVLPKGGLFAFDLPVAGKPAMNYRSWQEGRDWAVLLEAAEDTGAERLYRDIVVFRKVGRGWRRSAVRHVLQVPPRNRVVTALREAGFGVHTAEGYGDWPLPARRTAFLARKRG